MPFTKLFRLTHLISYLLLTSQVLFYILALADAMAIIPLDTFFELRKGIDKVIIGRLTVLYGACLLLSILAVGISVKEKNTLLIVTCTIGLLFLIIDLIIAVKGNMPINTIINASLSELDTIQQEALRTKWLNFIRLRGVLLTLGMISLMTGVVLNKKS